MDKDLSHKVEEILTHPSTEASYVEEKINKKSLTW
jgi:hypothetical protein